MNLNIDLTSLLNTAIAGAFNATGIVIATRLITKAFDRIEKKNKKAKE